ncbi:hypothetical protein [Microvirga antarctica]|uniref:hypothetical protein n=1 Tax=Microvirga antarctica TaxID=2819233 RepID=UPI001B30902E|nr:hypothetical protein [Microvirga antarctica]
MATDRGHFNGDVAKHVDQEGKTNTALILFGLDDAGKPHASSFNASDASLAEKAARLMGMKVLRLSTDEQQSLARKLPQGRIRKWQGVRSLRQ